MSDSNHPERLARSVLLAVAVWHLMFWVLAPALGYRMLPLDTLELLGWGQEWQAGYYKHPPLAAWLGEAVLQLAGGRLRAMYLLAQLCVLLAMLYVWLGARRLLDPVRAALAVALLEGSYAHTFLSPNFNMNLLQLPLWAALGYHALRAFEGASRHWLACGAIAALALLTKYSGLLPIATLVLLLLGTERGRDALGTPWPWLGAALGLLLLTPHLLWLTRHGALPLAYLGSFDTQASAGIAMHVIEPLRFAGGALLGVVFAFLIFASVWRRGGERRPAQAGILLVVALCLGPLLLSMAYGVVTGSRLKSTWAFPFFNFIGVALFLVLPTRVGSADVRRFRLAAAGVMLLFGASHLIYKLGSDRSKTAFDGQALATAVEQRWERRFATPLRIVAGDHVLTAIVSSYAGSRPSMLVEGDLERSLWLDRTDLIRHGAALVCETGARCPADLRAGAVAGERIRIDKRTFDLYFLAPGDEVDAADG